MEMDWKGDYIQRCTGREMIYEDGTERIYGDGLEER